MCGERSHLHDRIAPFRNRLVALTRALPEALIRNLNAHHQREAEHHAEHVQRIRMAEDAAIREMLRKDDAFKVVVRPLYDDAERAADDGPRQCAWDYRAVKLQQVGRDDHRDRALAVLLYAAANCCVAKHACLVTYLLFIEVKFSERPPLHGVDILSRCTLAHHRTPQRDRTRQGVPK